MPPIEAYEVGGAYFVSDGHHRVALALEQSWEYIDAEVTRIETNVRIVVTVDGYDLARRRGELPLRGRSRRTGTTPC
jgi:transketolase C-terminal domain/subunit